MKSMQGILIFSLLSGVFTPRSIAMSNQCDISGTWKHQDKAAWLDVDLHSKAILVKSHSDNANAEGLTVVKDLKQDAVDTSEWTGNMFDAIADDYVLVKMSVDKCKIINVSRNDLLILTLIRE